MTQLISVKEINSIRGLHEEEFDENTPLTCNELMELMANEASLYEYLSNQTVFGNDDQTVEGHSHGRSDLDGVYVSRYGTFNVGHLFEQSTTSTSYQGIKWEIFNTGGPVSTGPENSGSRITCTYPLIYIHQDYKNLVLNVLLKVQSSETATAKLTLLNNEDNIGTSTVTTTSATFTPKQFNISLLNNESYTGWCNLVLELKSSSSSATASIVSDDVLFKPLTGTILNGSGLLLGE